ncbi:MAG: methionyl-tRNA formyltransferase [Eubacteriales bacterium]|nr:methionyl-tRNA formyltransferase [Eubacteriales bacterium]
MRVVFMGTPDFATGTLKALLESKHEVAAVYSQPDKPRGRGKEMQFTPVKEVAAAAQVPVYQPVKVKDPEVIQQLKEICPDVIVVVAFGQIIPAEILRLPKFGCVNVHASLLPKYRGAAPIQWAVINGEKKSGVTTMKMDTGLDTGDMLLKKELELAFYETGGSLFDKLSAVGAELLLETLDKLEKGEVVPVSQPKESPTAYAAMLTKKTGNIDWNKGAVEIERLIRGLNPWPSAYTHLGGKTLKIWKASVKDSGKYETETPGTITEVTKQKIGVQTGDGLLYIEELQLEGKKRMPADAFLRGFELKHGMQLG